jgi:secretion/DNA translocation related TadE-like protein
LAFALVLVAWGSALVGATVVAHRAAQNAADLTALAAAGGGCSVAGEVATANRARLIDCTADGPTVSVVVAVGIPLGMHHEVRARARAGPMS